ncbi:hypothetical protein LEP1GSC061_3148 [Leptospira wolffii serovar Khorat str. Khorat-H2]|nr:hypothetical protein LEP1GSC061_3148 [Leptospira wolffii serovar Khorat str. Khorat-H2]
MFFTKNFQIESNFNRISSRAQYKFGVSGENLISTQKTGSSL